MPTTTPAIEIRPDIENHEIILSIIGKTGWSKELCLGKIIRIYLWALKFQNSLDLSDSKPEAYFQLISDENNDAQKLNKIFKEVGLLNNKNNLMPVDNFLSIRNPKTLSSNSVYDSQDQSSLDKTSLDQSRQDKTSQDKQDKSSLDRQSKRQLVVEPVDIVDNLPQSSEFGEKDFTDDEKNKLKTRINFFFKCPPGHEKNNAVLQEVFERLKSAKNIKNKIRFCMAIIENIYREYGKTLK